MTSKNDDEFIVIEASNLETGKDGFYKFNKNAEDEIAKSLGVPIKYLGRRQQ